MVRNWCNKLLRTHYNYDQTIKQLNKLKKYPNYENKIPITVYAISVGIYFL